MTFDGRQVAIHSPRDAAELGIEVVYQDLALCDNLDIVQNMFLGREKTRGIVLDEPTMEQMAGETLASLSVRTVKSLRQLVASLSGGQRQTVAIAKAVLWNSRVVILDEPTAALGVAQTAQVLELVRRLADNGLGVVLISHNMNDVFAVSDRIAALYLGRMAAQVKTTDVTHAQIVELITAGAAATSACRRERPTGFVDITPGGRPVTTDHRRPPAASRSSSRPSPATSGTTWAGSAAATSARLPAVLGLVVLCADLRRRPADDVLQRRATSRTCSPRAPQVTLIAMGLVFVLLLGEIDLSAGFASGVCGAVMAILLTEHGCSWYVGRSRPPWSPASVIGLVLGVLVAKLGIPSFVVTLAAFLGLPGRAADPARRRQEHLDPGRVRHRRWPTATCRSLLELGARRSVAWPGTPRPSSLRYRGRAARGLVDRPDRHRAAPGSAGSPCCCWPRPPC